MTFWALPELAALHSALLPLIFLCNGKRTSRTGAAALDSRRGRSIWGSTGARTHPGRKSIHQKTNFRSPFPALPASFAEYVVAL
jgi:hypothetical protein